MNAKFAFVNICVQTDDKLLQLIISVRSKISKKSSVHIYIYIY